ncbi:hypothetical protein [Trichocoleus sp. FACHB-262]|uniref:hypothetical protein n=1 Tax=Trichocoleus sp. FACHB-262 TaxID=2692869 RepID=UPI001685A584|nr:hypothetical protein [Trichocoleus sp. FACHB-262]MBD2120273.1 hypothetical protein [Trichocoleus sp. FACHB-262]
MTVLHVALQDGFVNDKVIILVNGEEVFHQSDIKTKFQIGLAKSFEVPVSSGSARIQVQIPSKSLSETVDLEIQESPLYLGVSVTPDRQISLQVSQEPFRYM